MVPSRLNVFTMNMKYSVSTSQRSILPVSSSWDEPPAVMCRYRYRLFVNNTRLCSELLRPRPRLDRDMAYIEVSVGDGFVVLP